MNNLKHQTELKHSPIAILVSDEQRLGKAPSLHCSYSTAAQNALLLLCGLLNGKTRCRRQIAISFQVGIFKTLVGMSVYSVSLRKGWTDFNGIHYIILKYILHIKY